MKAVKIQAFRYRDTTNVEPEMYNYNNKNCSHWNSNEKLKDKFGSCTRKTLLIDSLQKTATLGTSHIIWKVLQCEAWSLGGGDHLWFKRSTRKKRPVTREDVNNNNNNNNNNMLSHILCTISWTLYTFHCWDTERHAQKCLKSNAHTWLASNSTRHSLHLNKTEWNFERQLMAANPIWQDGDCGSALAWKVAKLVRSLLWLVWRRCLY